MNTPNTEEVRSKQTPNTAQRMVAIVSAAYDRFLTGTGLTGLPPIKHADDILVKGEYYAIAHCRKQQRWLGFVQGVMWATGLVTISGLAQSVTDAFKEASAPPPDLRPKLAVLRETQELVDALEAVGEINYKPRDEVEAAKQRRLGDAFNSWKARFGPDGAVNNLGTFDFKDLPAECWTYAQRPRSRSRVQTEAENESFQAPRTSRKVCREEKELTGVLYIIPAEKGCEFIYATHSVAPWHCRRIEKIAARLLGKVFLREFIYTTALRVRVVVEA